MAKRRPGFKFATWLKRYSKSEGWPDQAAIVAVLWTDATWVEGSKEDAGTCLILTVGVVVEAAEDAIKVAHEVHDDKDERGVTTIPSAIIQSIIPLANFKAFE